MKTREICGLPYDRIMAEIKSTMDLVMERAARMASNAAPTAGDEDQIKAGMRLAAEYLNGQLPDLAAELGKQSPREQLAVYKGAAKTLLRNIVLPRDEMLQERNTAALKGIQELLASVGASGLNQVCGELQKLLQQYGQHKEQVVKQLEEALLAQLEHQYAGKGVAAGQLRASMHPHYHDEMAKMEQDLNGQYTKALDQRKEMILQQSGLAS